MRILPCIALVIGLGAALATASSAARKDDPEAELAKLLAGRSAGAPQSCIPLFPSLPSQTIDRTAIVYGRGQTLYVNRFVGGCSALDSTRIVITRTPVSRLCRGDAADVMTQTPSTLIGTCIFDSFTPYTKTK